jgi:hypothetical protein
VADLAGQIYQRAQMDRAETDEDGFDDRRLWLDLTFAGAGRLSGDLTSPPATRTALSAAVTSHPASARSTTSSPRPGRPDRAAESNTPIIGSRSAMTGGYIKRAHPPGQRCKE